MAGEVFKGLMNFQSNGIDYLYNLETKQENLFWAGNFCELTDDKHIQTDESRGDGFRYMADACFRIQSVDLSLPKIDFEENKLTHAADFKSLTYSRVFNITWIEDVYRSITKYHLDWILYGWYDRPNDCLKTGTGGKFRHLEVCQWHWYNGAPTPIFIVAMDKIKPQNAGDKLSFNMKGPGDPLITINYVADEIQLLYMNTIDGIPMNHGTGGNWSKLPDIGPDHPLKSWDVGDGNNFISFDLPSGYSGISPEKPDNKSGGTVESWKRLLRTMQIENPVSEGFLS